MADMPEVWLIHHKKEEVKMAENKELKKVKLRLKGITRGPIEMTIMPKKKVILDENGICEVDEGMARRLLSPEYKDTGWELYKEEPVKAPSRKSKVVEEELSKEDFAQTI